MKYRTGSVLSALLRMDGVLDAHLQQFASLTGTSTRIAITDSITQLQTHAADQQGGDHREPG